MELHIENQTRQPSAVDLFLHQQLSAPPPPPPPPPPSVFPISPFASLRTRSASVKLEEANKGECAFSDFSTPTQAALTATCCFLSTQSQFVCHEFSMQYFVRLFNASLHSPEIPGSCSLISPQDKSGICEISLQSLKRANGEPSLSNLNHKSCARRRQRFEIAISFCCHACPS